MKQIIILMILVTAISCNAQESNQSEFTYENFDEEILKYQPKKGKIPGNLYSQGTLFLEEAKKRIKKNNSIDVADYFNLFSAFIALNESKKNIKIVFRKFKDSEGSCQYILSYEKDIEESLIYDIIREDYIKELEKCKSKPVVEKEFDIIEYCKTNSLDLTLVEEINTIKINDQKNRHNKNVQYELDKKNQVKIDSLYKVHKTYIGKTLVGNEFKNVMWAVIQHSNPEMMERYLPVVHKGVEDKELDVGTLKMLIDRLYGLKYGYQVFGSQSGFGFELADEKKRKEIQLKYGIKN